MQQCNFVCRCPASEWMCMSASIFKTILQVFFFRLFVVFLFFIYFCCYFLNIIIGSRGYSYSNAMRRIKQVKRIIKINFQKHYRSSVLVLSLTLSHSTSLYLTLSISLSILTLCLYTRKTACESKQKINKTTPTIAMIIITNTKTSTGWANMITKHSDYNPTSEILVVRYS